jgi:hypothetical protein
VDWTTILTPAIPAVCGLGLGILRLIAYWLRLRAELKATPEQLAAIERVEPPSFLINRGGPAVAMVAAGAALAIATMFSGYSGVAGARPDCSPATCKPPSRCTSDGCTNAAAPTSAVVAGDMPWSAPRTAMDGRAPWLGGGS